LRYFHVLQGFEICCPLCSCGTQGYQAKLGGSQSILQGIVTRVVAYGEML